MTEKEIEVFNGLCGNYIVNLHNYLLKNERRKYRHKNNRCRACPYGLDKINDEYNNHLFNKFGLKLGDKFMLKSNIYKGCLKNDNLEMIHKVITRMKANNNGDKVFIPYHIILNIISYIGTLKPVGSKYNATKKLIWLDNKK